MSSGHSVVLSQPTGNCVSGLTVDGIGGGACVGGGVGNSTIGGGAFDEGPGRGEGIISWTMISSVTGDGSVVGLSVDIAVHPVWGSPVVP